MAWTQRLRVGWEESLSPRRGLPSVQDETRSLGGGQPCPEEPSWACPPTSARHVGGDLGANFGGRRVQGPWGPGVENSESRPCLSCRGLGSRPGGGLGVPESSALLPSLQSAPRGARPGVSLPPGGPALQALMSLSWWLFPQGGGQLGLHRDCSLGPGRGGRPLGPPSAGPGFLRARRAGEGAGVGWDACWETGWVPGSSPGEQAARASSGLSIHAPS